MPVNKGQYLVNSHGRYKKQTAAEGNAPLFKRICCLAVAVCPSSAGRQSSNRRPFPSAHIAKCQHHRLAFGVAGECIP